MLQFASLESVGMILQCVLDTLNKGVGVYWNLVSILLDMFGFFKQTLLKAPECLTKRGSWKYLYPKVQWLVYPCPQSYVNVNF